LGGDKITPNLLARFAPHGIAVLVGGRSPLIEGARGTSLARLDAGGDAPSVGITVLAVERRADGRRVFGVGPVPQTAGNVFEDDDAFKLPERVAELVHKLQRILANLDA